MYKLQELMGITWQLAALPKLAENCGDCPGISEHCWGIIVGITGH